MKIKAVTTIILAEFIAIVLLGIYMYNKHNQVPSVSISPINKEGIGGLNIPPWLGYTPAYTINSDTLNDGSEYQIQKPKDTYRIMTLGDSFTFGFYVNTYDSYPETLERLLNEQPCNNKFEVLNLGLPGYDIRQSLERFKRRGSKYNPDLVIWFLVGGKNVFEHQSSFLDEFGDIYRKEFVMYGFKGWLSEEQEKRIRDFVEKHSLGHFYKSLLKLKKHGAFFPDGHPNQKGYLLMAQDMLSYLLKNNIIPCE